MERTDRLFNITRRNFAGMLAAGALALATADVGRARADAAAEGSTVAFEGGSGTPDDPYQVATAEQLAAVAADLAASYVLTADVDLTGREGWQPIGDLTYDLVDMETGEMDMSVAFSGAFDGNGHTVSGLTLVAGGNSLAAGLFGMVTGTVGNLVLSGANVAGGTTTLATGGVVGYLVGGTMENVTVTGSSLVSGINCVGGVCGGSDVGSVLNGCVADGATVVVLGSNDFGDGPIVQADTAECGGLVVGGAFGSAVDDCTATGTVVATGNEPVGLGGLAGCLQLATAASGHTVDARIVTTDAHAVGGLAGYAGNGDDGSGTVGEPTAITGCDVTVAIYADGATHVGGLVGTGLYYFGMEGRFAISDCTVSGSIDGAVTPGTVAGRATGSTIENCTVNVLVDGQAGAAEIGETDRLYESADQYEA